jgi:hypothetical protein
MIIGKVSILKHLRSPEVHLLAARFGDPTSTSEEIGLAGEKLMCLMYGGRSNDSLTQLRYTNWNQAIATANQIKPEELPHTARATHFHALRVHLKVSRATTLDLSCLNPSDWGWKSNDDQLIPIRTDLPPAPDFLLKVIRCNCKTSSRNVCLTKLCSCIKNGLICVPACGGCKGVACNNKQDEQAVLEEEEDDYTNIFDILDSF